MTRKRRSKTNAGRRKYRGNRGQLIALTALAAGFVLIVGLIVLGQGGGKESVTAGVDEDVLALGEQTYRQTCAACHGEKGEGHILPEAPALNQREHAWHHPDGQIQEIIKNGGVKMPPLGEQLTNEQIVAVIRYIQNWWTPRQLAQQQARSKQFPLSQ
ncbi:MAG: cytochrome c [Chloroflexi bacterium]|nr:cytochrome c [Chloroflexota bacterium]